MGVLTQTSRHQLLVLLAAVPGIDSRAGRDILLRDLPSNVVQHIPRADATALDLDAIIYAADNWWPPAGPVADYPLRLLVAAAVDLASGSQPATALQAFLDTLPLTIDSSARPRCPYPGMVPFSPADARFFYGREPEIKAMALRLRYNSFLLVIGPSGSGKSSLVTAGLLPAFAKHQPGVVYPLQMRPGAEPVKALADLLGLELATLAGGTPDAALAQAVAARLARPAASAPARVEAGPQPPSHTSRSLLLVVDQFEELFTQANRWTERWFIAVLKRLGALGTCKVVLLMRADFYPDLMQSTLWPVGEGARLEIAPLHGDALRTAISRPAADLGVEVEPDLIERLVADAADEPGSLPLLQEALVLLWEQLQGRALRLADYTALGRDGRSGLAVALASHADATYNGLTPAQQVVARRIFLRLVAFGEGRPDTRRQQPVAALHVPGEDPALFASTLVALTDHRLLTTSGAEQAAAAGRVDIAHEALIRGWPALQSWISERRAAEQARRRLEEQAAEWVRLGQGTGGLLDAAELPEAARWLAGPDATELGYSTTLFALMQASADAIYAAAQEKEVVRQRELAQAQALADEQRRRADDQARNNRRLRRGAVGLALLLLLAIAASGWAFLQTQEANTAQNTAELRAAEAVAAQATAETQSQVARAQALAVNAVNQLDRDPELSVLLATEALSISRHLDNPFAVPQAEDPLHIALLRSRLRLTLRGHRAPVIDAAWSPDGRYIATAGQDQTVKIWDAAHGQELRTLSGHTGSVESVAWSPDGKYIATAGQDQTAKIWDATSWQELPTLRGHVGAVESVAWSPDGKYIATASKDQTAKVWDATSGQDLRTLTGHTGSVESVAWSPNGLWIATASWDGTAKVWDGLSGQALITLSGHTDKVESVAWSPDSGMILTASDDKTVGRWFLAEGPRLESSSIDQVGSAQVLHASFHPEANLSAGIFVTASADGTVEAHGYNQCGGGGPPIPREVKVLGLLYRIPDMPNIFNGHTQPVTTALYSPDGHSVLTSSYDGTARVWVADYGENGERLPTNDRQHERVRTIAGCGHQWPTHIFSNNTYDGGWSLDGQRIVTQDRSVAPDHNDIKIWDTISGQDFATLPDDTLSVASVAWSPDGQRVAIIGTQNEALIWDPNQGTTIPLQGATGELPHATWSYDGKNLVTAGADGTAKIWDTGTGQLRVTLSGHTDEVWNAGYSPDGNWIVTASWDKTARIWDATTGQVHLTLQGHTAEVLCARYSLDGRSIVTASADGTARIWDATTGQVRHVLSGHASSVLSAAYSPDGGSIVTASSDGTARIWDATTGRQRAALHDPSSGFVSAVYTPDGHTVLTVNGDGEAREYVVDIDDLLTLAHTRVTRTLTPDERALYLGEPLPTATPGPAGSSLARTFSLTLSPSRP